MSIATLTTNYMLSNKKGKTKIQNGWKKPPEGMLMINVDAAFDFDSGSGGGFNDDGWRIFCYSGYVCV
uniref:Uncharacterized protein n=1 Tax=Oryza meridionalis TaxID=40149 RepID=A0A1V1H721_9ORYZ|nr:hypothetical protein [Oryza meridionalis]BAX24867.1 hypothetical protein [Oryza meridionalis]